MSISDHVTGSLVPRKGLDYLTSNPLCCRIGCDVDPRTVPTIELHDDEGIEPMVGTINKSMAATSGALGKCPSLAGWPSPLDHVFGDARLRDLKPELEQSL